MKRAVEPMRRCIGCRESKPKSSLIRIACDGERIFADPDARAEGRGAYLCRKRACYEKAVKSRAFARAFRCGPSAEDLEELRKAVSVEE